MFSDLIDPSNPVPVTNQVENTEGDQSSKSVVLNQRSNGTFFRLMTLLTNGGTLSPEQIIAASEELPDDIEVVRNALTDTSGEVSVILRNLEGVTADLGNSLRTPIQLHEKAEEKIRQLVRDVYGMSVTDRTIPLASKAVEKFMGIDFEVHLDSNVRDNLRKTALSMVAAFGYKDTGSSTRSTDAVWSPGWIPRSFSTVIDECAKISGWNTSQVDTKVFLPAKNDLIGMVFFSKNKFDGKVEFPSSKNPNIPPAQVANAILTHFGYEWDVTLQMPIFKNSDDVPRVLWDLAESLQVHQGAEIEEAEGKKEKLKKLNAASQKIVEVLKEALTVHEAKDRERRELEVATEIISEASQRVLAHNDLQVIMVYKSGDQETKNAILMRLVAAYEEMRPGIFTIFHDNRQELCAACTFNCVRQEFSDKEAQLQALVRAVYISQILDKSKRKDLKAVVSAASQFPEEARKAALEWIELQTENISSFDVIEESLGLKK